MATATFLGLTLSLSAQALTALRIAPLLGATASITHAYMEWLTTTSFLHAPNTTSGLTKSIVKDEYSTAPPTNQDQVDAAKEIVVPVWFTNFFHTGVISVIGFNTLTTCSALANLFLFPGSLGEHRNWYMYGLAAAVGHFAFVPGVMGSVEALFKMCVRQQKGEERREEEKKAGEYVREWVGVHKVRVCTVDLATWVCFAVGVVGVLTKQ